MKKLLLTFFTTISIFGFAGVAFALPYYTQTQSMVPGQNDKYNIGTTSPSTLEYNNIFTKNITVSGTCAGCSVASTYNFPLSGNATSTLTQFNGGLTAFASSTIGAGALGTGLTIFGGATTTGTTTLGADLLFTPDGVGDIGASFANRPRNLYMSGNSINIGGTVGSSNAQILAQNGYLALISNLNASWKPYIQLLSSNGSDHGAIYMYYGGGNATKASDSGSTFNIINNDNGSNTNVFNIQNSGRVGISTSSPAMALDIQESSGSVLRLERNGFQGTTGLDITLGGGGTTMQNRGTFGLQTNCGPTFGACTTNLQTNGFRTMIGGTNNGGSGALWVNAGTIVGSNFSLTGAPTNGLVVEGNTGVGTTSPFGKFAISVNPADTLQNNTIFSIASSTATATTSIFRIDNQGNINVNTNNNTLYGSGTTNLTLSGNGTAGNSNYGTLVLRNPGTLSQQNYGTIDFNNGNGIGAQIIGGGQSGGGAQTRFEFWLNKSSVLTQYISIDASAQTMNLGTPNGTNNTSFNAYNTSSGAEITAITAHNMSTPVGSNVAYAFGTQIGGSATTTGTIVGVKRKSSGTMTGDISFSTNNVGTLSEKMRITGEGSLGIGTTSPAGTLSVQGASAGSATTGTCFRAKNANANSYTFWYFPTAGVAPTYQTNDCGGASTTTVTFD